MIGVVIVVCVLAAFGLSSSSSTGRRQKQSQNTTVIIQQSLNQQMPQNEAIGSNSAITDFAVRNYSKIDADEKQDGGAYLASLITLMENVGIPHQEAYALTRQALRRADGDATVFGEHIRRFTE